MKVRVESGPEGDPLASCGDVLGAVVETLAVKRPDGLADPKWRGFGLFTPRDLARSGESFDVFSHQPSYSVDVMRMPEEQVSVISNPSSYAELAADDRPLTMDDSPARG